MTQNYYNNRDQVLKEEWTGININQKAKPKIRFLNWSKFSGGK